MCILGGEGANVKLTGKWWCYVARCWWVAVGSIVACVGVGSVIVVMCGVINCEGGLVVSRVAGVCSVAVIGAGVYSIAVIGDVHRRGFGPCH